MQSKINRQIFTEIYIYFLIQIEILEGIFTFLFFGAYGFACAVKGRTPIHSWVARSLSLRQGSDQG
jgi:hypothetical protein